MTFRNGMVQAYPYSEIFEYLFDVSSYQQDARTERSGMVIAEVFNWVFLFDLRALSAMPHEAILYRVSSSKSSLVISK